MLAIDGGTRPQTITTPPTSAPPPLADARSMVAAVTDPKTGAVDTRQLGTWVADAAKTSPETASAAYAQIEAQLGAGDASRLAEDTAAAMRRDQEGDPTYSASTPGTGADVGGRQVLRNNPILEVQWHSTISPVSGKSGFSGPLREAMTKAGITFDPDTVHQRPANGTTANTSASKTHNGNAARDALADGFRADPQYSQVQNEKNGLIVRQTSLGDRHVDVTAIRPGGRPEDNVRVDAESKLGYAGKSTSKNGNLNQVLKDGERLADNAAVRRIGTVAEGVGKVARPVGLVVDAVQLGSAWQKDGGTFGDNTQHAAAGLAGGAAGAWGGAQVGAAIGSFGGPIGTVAGGIVGGVVGGIVGSGVADKAVDWVKGWF